MENSEMLTIEKDSEELRTIHEHALKKHKPYIYKGTTVTIKPRLTIQETYEIVERVVNEAFLDGVTFSKLHADVAFMIALVDLGTDYKLPTKDVNGELMYDSQAACDAAYDIGPCFAEAWGWGTYDILCNFVNERIQFEKDIRIAAASRSVATENAIETVSELAYRTLEVVNKIGEQVDRNGDRLFKNLTPKKIEKLVDGLIGKISSVGDKIATDA